jgi:hypothetical protein
MKKILILLICVVLIFCVLPVKQNLKAAQSLIVSYSPAPLTAGCVPELVDPSQPFTIYVNDENGNPVDLTLGGEIDDRTVWNVLFKDSHPKELGQYYWVRTDLHNDDGTKISNKALFGFEPISIDFSMAKEGKYIFKGFCTNDAGAFYITVYSPDRKLAGSVKVEVVKPTVSYEVVNTEDPERRVFTIPGDPDFALTAGDNRIYEITVSAKNAQGLPIKGVDKDINICGGVKEYARFTPYTTKPANFEFTKAPRTRIGTYNLNGSSASFLIDNGGRYFLHLGIDYNLNGKIDVLNKEVHEFDGFRVRDADSNGNIVATDYYTYYITSNVMWEDGTFVTSPQFDFPPPYEGWGLGSIYNLPYDDGYLFPDLNNDGKLDYHDSLVFDTKGKCKFYIFAEDITNVGGLVGCNPYGNIDAAGGPPISSDSPRSVERRYRRDYVFYLDFDCIPTTQIGSGRIKIRVYNAKTDEELPKNFINPYNYDIIYAFENHLKFKIYPADIRDYALFKDGMISITGAQHENTIYSKIKNVSESSGRTQLEATMLYTPTGLGEKIAWVDFYFENKNFSPPYQMKIEKLLYFDSILGSGMEVFPETIYVNEDNEVTVKVKEVGTGREVADATVKITGCGVSFSGKTDSNGKLTTILHPTETGEIAVEASKEGMMPGKAIIRVIKREQKLFLEIDPVKSPTNIPDITITGKTLPEARVSIGDNFTIANEKGNFTIPVRLTEGFNQLIVVAQLNNEEVKKSIEIILDTTGPEILVDKIEKLIDRKEFTLKGRVEPEAKVTVNGISATVVHDLFEVQVPVVLGSNEIVIIATDVLGNTNSLRFEVYNYHQILIKLVIGNVKATIDGNEIILEHSPFILNGRTFVPVRFIAEAFNADVEWIKETESVIIKLGETTIILQVGNNTAFINGKAYLLDAPPVIRNGRTFVPVRFIAEAFNADVEWIKETQEIIIRRLV